MNPGAAASRSAILLADDEPAVLRSIERVLSAAGYDVVVAGDGQTALRLVENVAFDVIVSDIQMPGVTGIELLRTVREHDLDVPVLLMTGDPRVETAVHALELGAHKYLLKPVDADAVCRAVERAVLLHRMARAKREAMQLLGNLQTQEGDIIALGASFDRALTKFWMAFQPIIEPSKSRIYGFEALLRSEEPALPTPGAVLQAGERLDRLPELGRRIRAAVADACERAPQGALLFVNVHPHDLNDDDLYSPRAPLARFADRTVLEITERASLDNVADVRRRLTDLRARGYRIALDDLGAGYAGLTSFALLEPELVKLDMSLVRDVESSPVKEKLIRSIASVCDELGIAVVAEGIETPAERDAVLPLGCTLLQGFLFGRPAPPFPTVEF